MSQLKFGSAGVTAREIDLTAPAKVTPLGVPAGVIGTANEGPAFVPVTVANYADFYQNFGPSDGEKFGPLAMAQWLANSSAATYLRVLGAGDGTARNGDGTVTNAGFTVGDELPAANGTISPNSYANLGGFPGRTYFLAAFMSESAGSTHFTDAGLAGGISPIVRGVLMAPSGVVMRLSSSLGTNSGPPISLIANNESALRGGTAGVVDLSSGKQQFVLLLNGHIGNDQYPNVLTASFDITAQNYFKNVFNQDPTKIQQAGHYLYAGWDIPSSLAVVTGSGFVTIASGAAGNGGLEPSLFIITGSLTRDLESDSIPNYENFRDRFSAAATPWFVSQKFGGSPVNLFKLHAKSDGAGVGNKYKVSIENIIPSGDPSNKHGTFDIIIRDAGDSDNQLSPIEQWRGVNLDPSSDRYVAKVLGDSRVYYDFDHETRAQKLVYAGNYPNNSVAAWVEVDPGVENGLVPPEALPVGFRGIGHLVTSGSAPMPELISGSFPGYPLWITSSYTQKLVEPPVPFRKNILVGAGARAQASPRLYWGVQFEHPLSTSRLNEGSAKNGSIDSFSKYFPNFSTQMSFYASDNQGVADTVQNGVMDADRFNNNLFTLENIQVTTGSDGLALSSGWATAKYVRTGSIPVDSVNGTRAVSLSDFNSTNRKYLKFSTIMQGGFDGTNILDSDSSKLTNAAVDYDMLDPNRGELSGPTVAAYRKGIDIMKNTTDVELQLLAIPGIRNPAVTDYAIDAVENRFDALYIMDPEQYDDNDQVIHNSGDAIPSVQWTTQGVIDRQLNTSFAAAYFPDVVVTDPETQTNVTVPPSVAVLGALSLNDKVGYPWFAPAGFTRGALASVLEADVKLSKDDMDKLYDASVNPIVSFPGTIANPAVQGGLVVWGQKTLLAGASALDRVNVRRLLIEIRRQVRQISQQVIFEPNRASTLARFSAQVTPILQRIQSLSGLDRYKVVIDASTTTQQDIENNTIRGKIYVQPTKSIEFVSLDFIVTNNISQQ